VEVWELKLYFYPSAGGLKKKEKKKRKRRHAITSFAPPLCELQHARSQVRQFSRQSRGDKL